MPFQWNADSNANGATAESYSNSHEYTERYSYIHDDAQRYGNRYFHCNSYCDCHGDFHSHFHPNYNSTTNSDIYAYGYFDAYTQANAYAQAAWNAQGTTHPAAAPVITGISRQTSEWSGVADPGYSLSRPSITFSMPLTTSVNRS